MKILPKIKKIQCRCNAFITRQLRKVSIFQRLNISFLVLLLGTAVFLTFFSFSKYSAEIIFNLERYASMSVQNIQLKVQDIMQEYEEIAVQFYEDEEVLRAVAENVTGVEGSDVFRQNRHIVESKLYHMGHGKKYIKSIQMVSAGKQYHMAEENGYQRGGTIRNLDEFYQSNFYQEAKARHGYPVWIEDAGQNYTFYESEQSVYGLADIITLSVAIYQPETRALLGVLTMNVDIKAFTEAARGYEAYQDSNLFLIGENGVITAFNPNIAFPSFPSDRGLFESMRKNKKQVIRTKFDGEDVLFAYENIPGTKMFSVYIADMKILLERTGHTRNLSILVLFGIVIGCFAISYYVTKSISEPVRRLVKVMGKAGDGKWTVRYQNSGNDEITVLGERFNEMADKTNQLIEQVYLSEIRRQKLQLSWKNAQLDAMLMQINPHFLYNTLSAINWRAKMRGAQEISDMVEALSNLLRVTLNDDSGLIPLEKELSLVQSYIVIQRIRFDETLDYRLAVEADELKDVLIPKLTLQPLIENAIRYGLEQSTQICRVQLSVRRQGAQLVLLVQNDGSLYEDDLLEKLRQKTVTPHGYGIGLLNIEKRLEFAFGKEAGLELYNEDGMATARITIPCRVS